LEYRALQPRPLGGVSLVCPTQFEQRPTQAFFFHTRPPFQDAVNAKLRKKFEAVGNAKNKKAALRRPHCRCSFNADQ